MTIADNLRSVTGRIAAACQATGRQPDSVRLLPISKTQPIDRLRQAMAAGRVSFGENRVQEMAAKAALLGPGVSWCLVGHLQRNKVYQALAAMTELQSLDSARLAEVLQRALAASGARLRVLVEVNTSGEASKHGLDPGEVMAFTAGLVAYPNLAAVGLMTVAHPDPILAGAGFDQVVELQDRLRQRDGGGWDELSMGMSGDFEAAIGHGSTCVRIGTAIFGARPSTAIGPAVLGSHETIDR